MKAKGAVPKGPKAAPKGPKAKGAKARGAAGPTTATAVIKNIKEVTHEWGAVMLQSNNLAAKIESDAKWQWANTDRFGGKLKRCIERCHEALQADPRISASIMDGEPMREEQVGLDINGTLSRTQSISTALETVNGVAKRLRTLDADDEPSQ